MLGKSAISTTLHLHNDLKATEWFKYMAISETWQREPVYKKTPKKFVSHLFLDKVHRHLSI